MEVVRCLVEELGADIDGVLLDGATLVFMAAQNARLEVVTYLAKECGADVSQAMHDGVTPLLISACQENMDVMRWLLIEGGAKMTESSKCGDTAWSLLKLEGRRRADDNQLSSLLQAMFLLGDAPLNFIAKLSPQHAEICIRGGQLWKQLPAYLEQQRTSVVGHCSQPVVLQSLVVAYALLTSDDTWTQRLRIWIDECSHSSRSGAGLLRCTACQQVRYCGQQCQQAHWKAHKADCKRRRAELKEGQGATGD
jgi:hypothetical protein